jgi:hypothetical protein
MKAGTLVAALERRGASLKTDGGKLKLLAPVGMAPDAETIAELRKNKTAVLEYLRDREQHAEIQFSGFSSPTARQTEKLERWPPESLDAERRFGQPHAKLFPFIGRKVRTPAGPGTLIQVFAERVTVLLDCELRKCARFHPEKVTPAVSE